jgi:hypothetical protein
MNFYRQIDCVKLNSCQLSADLGLKSLKRRMDRIKHGYEKKPVIYIAAQ